MKIQIALVGWAILLCLVCRDSLAQDDLRNIGNSPVNAKLLDSWTENIFITNAHNPAPISGPLRRWSVYVRRTGTLTFLILRKISSSESSYTIKYSEKIDFSSVPSSGKAYSKSCSGSCFHVEKDDAIGFYYKSTGGIVPYNDKSSSCTDDRTYVLYYKSHSPPTVGTTHQFQKPYKSWKRCRVYSLQVTLGVYTMQKLSTNRAPHYLTNIASGTIYSQIGSTYATQKKSLLILKSSNSPTRFRLQFEGAVRLAKDGSQLDPEACITGSRHWLSIYEYGASYKKLNLLPRLCGKWESDRNIPVLPDIYSTTNEVHIEFNTESSKSPGSGFIIVFNEIQSSSSSAPMWLKDTCHSGKSLQLQMNKNSYEAKYIYSAQTFPSENLPRTHNPLGSFHCSIYINGLTGREQLGLVFTWFQFPSCSASNIKVYNAKKYNYTNHIASACGVRRPFLVTSTTSRLRIEIRGDIGYGFSFGVYSSSKYMTSQFEKDEAKKAEKKDGGGGLNGLYAIPGVFIVIMVCAKGKGGKRPNQPRPAPNPNPPPPAAAAPQAAAETAPQAAAGETAASNDAANKTPAADQSVIDSNIGKTPPTGPSVDGNKTPPTDAANDVSVPPAAAPPSGNAPETTTNPTPTVVPSGGNYNNQTPSTAPLPLYPLYPVGTPDGSLIPSAGNLYLAPAYAPLDPTAPSVYHPSANLPPVEQPWSTGLTPGSPWQHSTLPPIAPMEPPPSYNDVVNQGNSK